MKDLENVNDSRRCRCRIFQLRHLALLVRIGSSSCWKTLFLFFLAFVLQISRVSVASAAPPPFRVGACLSAKDMPEARVGESDKQHYERTMTELKDIARSISQKVRASMMTVEYPILPPGPIPPSPIDCDKFPQKREYDIWLRLIYMTKDGGFVFDVFKWKGPNLVRFETNPDGNGSWPDANETRELLADAGQRIVESKTQSTVGPTLFKEIRNARSGIIFVYDSSGSMNVTDHSAQNRLNVTETIGDILMHTTQVRRQPVPFAVVVFAKDAEVLENTPGSKWFQTTQADLQTARPRLIKALKDNGQTNIGAAFEEVKQLMESRKDIEHWHVVFLTDGVPTAGITDYAELTESIKTDLGGKSTLSAIALNGDEPRHTETAKLAALVDAIQDAAGEHGRITTVKHDDLARFTSAVEDIAYLIGGLTVRAEEMLKCTYDSSTERTECKVDNSKPHALQFGAARKVKFIADTTALPEGKCAVAISNQGLGTQRTLELSEGQQNTVLHDPAFDILLSRSRDKVFLEIEMKTGRVNGDWQIVLTVDAPTRRNS